MTEPNGQVVYSVKELLAKVDGKIDAVLIAVSQKVDRSEFDELRHKVESLERGESSTRSVSEFARWLWTAAAPLVAAGATYYLTRH